MKKFWQDFKAFIKRGNVVDMAVGVAVASAFTAIVTAFTKGFISPLIALVSGHSDMSEMKWVIKEAVLDAEGAVQVAEVSILWGSFLQAIINFLIVALALFVMLRVVTGMRSRALKLSQNVKNRFSDEDEKLAAAEAAAAEEKARAEAEAAEAAAAAAAEAAEAARLLEEEKANEKARIAREEALLTEMRDLLREIRSK